MTTTYCQDSDLHNAFGKENVESWADVNNNGSQPDIDARCDWARVNAKAYLDARLAGTRYKFPLDNPAAAPQLLKLMESYQACMYLSESRSIVDTEGGDQGDLKWIAKRVEKFIADVWSGRVTFPGLASATGGPIDNAPSNVSFPDPRDQADAKQGFPFALFTRDYYQ